jgi:hypothetical protein
MARGRKPTAVDAYLSEPVCLGGEWLPRWQAWQQLRDLCKACDHRAGCRCADYWMMGYDSRARREQAKEASP